MKTTVKPSVLTCSVFLQSECDLRTHMELLLTSLLLLLVSQPQNQQEKTEFESFCFSIKEVSEGPAVLNVLKVSLLWENLELVSAAGAL